MQSTAEKILLLVDRLAEATRSSLVKWELVEYRANTYRVNLPAVSIVIREEFDEGLSIYSIEMGNSQTMRNTDVNFWEAKDPGFDKVRELYQLARTNALRVDSMIEGALADLSALQKK
jgi:hypothetical protein